MAKTPLDEVIHNLRTAGGSQGEHVSFFDQDRIVFSVGSHIESREANFAKAALLVWADLIDIPVVFGNSDVNIRLDYTAELKDAELGVNRPSWFFSVDHFTQVLINRNHFPDDHDADLRLGDAEWGTYLHELGHALGLTHPGPYNGNLGLVYGVDNVYPEDTLQFTIMSYFSAFNDGVPDTFFITGSSTTPMLHDIAAVQSIYGANMSTRTGDNIYGFNSNNARTLASGFTFDPFDFSAIENPSFTIWDAGGIDTIDASGFSGYVFNGDYTRPHQIIDLRAGEYSSIGFSHQGVQSNGVPIGQPLRNNIAIAYGVTIENAIGGDGDDRLTGNEANNVLRGNYGDDTILAGDGNDILEGGPGADYLGGQSGFDTASYAHSNGGIRLMADRANDSGDVRGDVFSSIEAFLLTPFDDIFNAFDDDERIDGGDGDDQIFGMGGNDTLIGGFGIDRLFGGDGDDRLDGGIGADQMSGGAGDDTYFVDNPGDIVSESILIASSGVDLVISSISYALPLGVENLTLVGPGPLTGTGNSLANTITGNASSNTLDGGGGADTLVGRGGNDTYIVDNAGDVVDESTGGSADIDTVLSSVTFSLSPLASAQTRGSVENLTLTGTAAINGIGNSLANILIGNNAANVLTGLEGADWLDGGGGADTMFGGTGNDSYVVDNAADRVDETTGGAADIDTVQSSVTFSLINSAQSRGNVENLTLTGTANINGTGNDLDNVMIGNSGRNFLIGGAGSDDLIGGGGNDQLFGGSGNDSYMFSGSFGSDTINDESGTADRIVITGKSVLLDASRTGNNLILELSGGTITIVNHFTTGTVESLEFNGRTVVLAKGLIGGDLPGIIAGSDASETMDGKGGDDFLYGGKGNDTLLGGLGDDLLDGGQGRDILDGGAGDDILTGGRGGDSFVFRPGFGHDTITDFALFEDRLDISGFHSRPGFSRSGLTLELNFGGGDTLSINFEGADHWLPALQSTKFVSSLFDFW